METLEILKEYSGKSLMDFPKIVYSNLYKKVINNFYFEFNLNQDNFLFSPYYTLLQGEKIPELLDVIDRCEEFLDSLKEYIINSLFVYSALIEENAYYLSKPQSIIIVRLVHNRDYRFEVKFYTHYEDELLKSYKDKIYIGRDFINLKKFERKYLGLKKYFLSLIEQNQKIQERAKQKLRYYDDYKKEYLDEVDYLTKEAFRDAMQRVKFFRETKMEDIPKTKIAEVVDELFYMNNLMIELRDFTQEFENKLRMRDENQFVKYLTKFSKDLIDGIRYLRKLTCLMHMKISNLKY